MKQIQTGSFQRVAAQQMNAIQTIVSKHGPYAYHVVSNRESPRKVRVRVKNILIQGLQPGTGESWHEGWQTPRTGRVYLFLPDSAIYDPSEAQIRVDLRNLDPSKIGCDEDIFDPTVSNWWQTIKGVADPGIYSMSDWQEGMPTLGDWADKHSHIFDHPKVALNPKYDEEGYSSISYAGVIPPQAVSLNPEYGK